MILPSSSHAPKTAEQHSANIPGSLPLPLARSHSPPLTTWRNQPHSSPVHREPRLECQAFQVSLANWPSRFGTSLEWKKTPRHRRISLHSAGFEARRSNTPHPDSAVFRVQRRMTALCAVLPVVSIPHVSRGSKQKRNKIKTDKK